LIRGSILLYVVWAVMLLSLFTLSVASHASFALQLTERLSGQLRSAAVARGAVQYAARLLELDQTPSADNLTEPWADDAGFFRRRVGNGTFDVIGAPREDGSARYGMVDEERKVSLNGAPPEVLRRLFETAGQLREDEAEALADAVQDWRDEDDRERPKGAEGIYYRSLSGGYDCKNGPFENVEEVLLLRGVTPELYQRLEPHLTAHGSGRLNLNTAGAGTLQALGLTTAGLEGLLAYRAGEDNAPGTADDRLMVSVAQLGSELARFVPVEDLARLERLTQDEALGVGSEAFRMSVEASAGKAGTGIRVACILNRRGIVQQWSEQ
jgi:general secretion pathway protein K